MRIPSILFVTDSLRANHGVAISGRFILIALEQYSDRITLYSNECSNGTRRLLHDLSISSECISIPEEPLLYRGVGWIGPRTIVRFARNICNYLSWSTKNKDISADLIFVNGPSVSYRIWKRVEHHTRGKKVLIVHESPRHFQVSFLISIEEVIAVFKSFDALIFVSDRGREEWLALSSCFDKPHYFIPNCADENLAKSLLSVSKATIRSRKKIPQLNLQFLCLGTIEQRKGQDYLIDKFPLILKTYQDASLYIVGSDASGWAIQLQRRVKKMGLSSKIHFLPYQQNGMEMIYASDILIVPSRAEAMPLVILEAMCLKTPVVASHVDGITELIEHDNTGWLFDLEKLESFQYVIESACNVANRKRVAENAYTKYWENFSQAQLTQRYKSALQDMFE